MDDDDHQGSKLTVAFLGLVSESVIALAGWVALLLEPVEGELQTYRRVGLLMPKRHGPTDSVKTAPLCVTNGIKPQCITVV
jgi:hypothetical protein